MAFLSMSVTAYVTHIVGAVAVGIALGAGAVYALSKATEKQVQQEPVKEEKQLLVLENSQ